MRFLAYAWHRVFRANKTFALEGQSYPYAVHLQNATFRNERAVEIPIALGMFPLAGQILEVGNVLSQYGRFPHDIVDKYEEGAGVVNVDIVDYEPGKRYDTIISISTLEHVGWDETPREPEKLLRAMAKLRSLLTPGGRLLITVPLGYNSCLDAFIRDGAFEGIRWLYLERVSRANDWVQTTQEKALQRGFASRYPCANALAVGMRDA